MKHKRKPYWNRWGVRRAIKQRKAQLVAKHFPLNGEFSAAKVQAYMDDIFRVSMFRYTRRGAQ